MRKKTCILAIGIILLLEGIFLPCVLLNKFPANAINGITAETQKAASANVIAADNYDSIKDNQPAAGTRNPTPQNKAAGNKKIRKQAKKIYRKNKQILVLVNADHALEESYQANLRPICNGRLNASDYLYPSLVKMLADASESGFTYWIASAWRSREKQQKLIDEDVRIAMQKGLSYDDALSDTYKSCAAFLVTIHFVPSNHFYSDLLSFSCRVSFRSSFCSSLCSFSSRASSWVRSLTLFSREESSMVIKKSFTISTKINSRKIKLTGSCIPIILVNMDTSQGNRLNTISTPEKRIQKIAYSICSFDCRIRFKI